MYEWVFQNNLNLLGEKRKLHEKEKIQRVERSFVKSRDERVQYVAIIIEHGYLAFF